MFSDAHHGYLENQSLNDEIQRLQELLQRCAMYVPALKKLSYEMVGLELLIEQLEEFK